MSISTISMTPDSSQPEPDLLALKREQDRKEEIAGYIKQLYTKAKNDRKGVERQWYMNLSFHFGRQNVSLIPSTISTTGFKLYMPPAPPWRVRIVVNKIRSYVRRNTAKLVQQRPRFVVLPASTEDEDLVAARVGEQIFDFVYREHQVRTVLRRVAWWGSICGTSFAKHYWDPSADDPAAQLDPMLMAQGGMSKPGNFCIEHVTPFHLFVPNLKDDSLESQPWVIHATMKSKDFVQMHYGLEAPVTTKATDEILEDSFLNMIGAQTQKEEVLVLEAWFKPGQSKRFPNGALVTVAGDVVVQLVEQYPYEHKEYPFSKYEDVYSGKFYADSVVTDLLPLQKEYNRTRSQIIENKNRMAKLQLIAPRGSIDPSKVTSEPGQVILYTPGFQPPQPLPLQSLPPYVLEEVQQLQQDMDDIAGQHEVSRGQNPAQVTAATALSYLQEQDDTMISEGVASLEAVVEKMGKHVLSYVSQFWAIPRIVRVVGTNQVVDASIYKGANLKGNHDVKVEAGSALPTSKAAKQAFLMDLMKMGFIQPQDGLELLDLGGIEKAYEDFLVDLRQAQRENLLMAKGASDFAVHEWDNHAVHIAEHNKYRKQQQYELMSPQLKEAFQQHVAMHQALLGMLEPPGLDGGLAPGITDPAMLANGGAPPMGQGMLPPGQGG